MKKEIITIAGRLGSGKSSTGNRLAELLGYRRFSMGDLQRKYSEKLGMDFTSYTEMQKTDHSIDKKIDEYQKEIGETENQFILDSRLGWFFIPESFKVFLDIPIDISADRIMQDAASNPNRATEIIESKEDVIARIEHRIESEKTRYKDLYNIDDHFNMAHFDIVIDTSKHNLEQVVAIIKEVYENWRIKP